MSDGVDAWAKKMKSYGGEHPFTYCVNSVSGVKDPQAFCASAHMKAFGMTPTERKAKKKTKKGNFMSRIDGLLMKAREMRGAKEPLPEDPIDRLLVKARSYKTRHGCDLESKRFENEENIKREHIMLGKRLEG